MACVFACATLAGLVGGTPASAHEMRPAISTIAVGSGQVRVVLSLNLEAAIAGIGPEHDETSKSPVAAVYDELRMLSPEELRESFAQFAPRLLEGISLQVDGQATDLAIANAIIPEIGNTALPRPSAVTLSGEMPKGDALTWRLAPELGDSVVRLQGNEPDEILEAVYVPAGETAGPLTLGADQSESGWRVFVSYIEVGFVHIVPRGLDHILFVVGLFLLSTRLSALLWQISAFTVAHTITLALGAASVVSISPAIVEPLIAASIVWIGIENLMTNRLHRWRPVLVFGFGLLHGLGFAGVLEEFGLSPSHFLAALLGFNLGVELGQLAVIAICFVAVGWAMRARAYRWAITVPGSVAISCVAAFWTVERAGLL